MTKKWGSVFAIFLVAAGVVFLSGFTSSVPTYVSGAQDRLESYLSYSYGPQRCSSAKEQSGQWKITCAARNGAREFTYNVYDASDKAYGFTLAALNDSARETRTVDLLTYLDIKTAVN
ncbi:Uncharacterised protein [Cedecea lapagei]|uniref:Uncharacterized protein n=1 Tax=Cedecea lapagei TaxID=158823 RepID=A0A3S4JC21_9ENTR|nr:hypothetical protein [Cedecea lapagei]VEB98173.1 Uncharacterised protein [Cedecea lapagei]